MFEWQNQRRPSVVGCRKSRVKYRASVNLQRNSHECQVTVMDDLFPCTSEAKGVIWRDQMKFADDDAFFSQTRFSLWTDYVVDVILVKDPRESNMSAESPISRSFILSRASSIEPLFLSLWHDLRSCHSASITKFADSWKLAYWKEILSFVRRGVLISRKCGISYSTVGVIRVIVRFRQLHTRFPGLHIV